METFFTWLQKDTHLIDILLLLATASALIVYFWQRNDRKKAASTMIVLQIEEIQEKIKVLESYIVDGAINHTAFYESLPVITDNHWSEYKHLFTGELSASSFRKINEFFQLAEGINAEHEKIKEFQTRSLFLNQEHLATCEKQILIDTFSSTENLPNSSQISEELTTTGMPVGLQEFSSQLISSMMQNSFNFDFFGKTYTTRQNNFLKIFNQSVFTPYVPAQARMTIEKLFKLYSHINIESNEGFIKLKKIAKIN